MGSYDRRDIALVGLPEHEKHRARAQANAAHLRDFRPCWDCAGNGRLSRVAESGQSDLRIDRPLTVCGAAPFHAATTSQGGRNGRLPVA